MNSTTVNNSNDAFGVFNTIGDAILGGLKELKSERTETDVVGIKPGFYVNGKYTGILKEGTPVCVFGGVLVNGKATHVVTSMRCNMVGANSDITVVNLDTFELINIVL